MDSKPIRMVTVPKAVIKRLPMYFRFINQLIEQGTERISSRELSQLMGITSSQLRQDLSYFGEFGQQGYGYKVVTLKQAISSIIGLEKIYNAIIVGAGNMGKAIAGYPGFSRRGLKIIGIFDNNPEIIGNKLGSLDVLDVKTLPEFLNKNPVEVGIITTPASVAQEIADILITAGVKGIWNFAPVLLHGNKNVIIEDIHVGDSLMTLFFKLNKNK
ncbi:MAG: redox-sensing transcriptional repressor [Clostridia bacterium]|nr:redox-sensing transcriptional repressor [Clostridia bacterium]MDN5321814.1 redox-sensing transcriptional repressor [Clostridia bacterium]